MYPDNVSKEVYEREYFQGSAEDDGGWTVVKLLKTKEMWLCALIIGINQLVTTGVMSQLVVRNVGIGFTQEAAIGLMTVCALIGVAVGAAANFIVSLPASVFGRQGFTVVNSVFFPLMQIVLTTNYAVNAAALKVTGSLRGAYFVYIGLLVVNMVLTVIINPTRYNKDVAVEQELTK